MTANALHQVPDLTAVAQRLEYVRAELHSIGVDDMQVRLHAKTRASFDVIAAALDLDGPVEYYGLLNHPLVRTEGTWNGIPIYLLAPGRTES